MAKTRYDWSTIRREYVDTPETITKTALAAQYGMALDTIVRKARKEHWDFDHQRFLQRDRTLTTEKKADAVSSFGAKWDGKCADEADKLLTKALAEMATDTKAKDVAGALQIAQNMGKAAAGDTPDLVTAFAVVAAEAVQRKP